MSLPIPDTSAETAPDSPPPAPSDTSLNLRQEDFCRHYAATGNAAGAAREVGYAEGSARQTGHDLLERPAIAERVRGIRAAWRAVEREEAQILLGRLEQAWDIAVEKGSATLMLRVIKLQAELSGLDRRNAGRRAGLWPLPGDVSGEDAMPDAGETGAADAAEPGPPVGPLVEAVRRGRHRTERALALHRVSRKALERYSNFDVTDWLATARRLHATVEERRPRNPARAAHRPAPAMTDPDISLHGSLHPATDAPVPDSAPDAPTLTDHDISLHRSLHRAGLLPAVTADRAGGPALDVRVWRDDPFGEERRIRAEGREMTFEETLAYRAALTTDRATDRIDYDDPAPGLFPAIPHGGTFLQPAGDPGPEERRAAEEEQDVLKSLARTRPPLASETAGSYLYEFARSRPCRGEERTMTEHDNS